MKTRKEIAEKAIKLGFKVLMEDEIKPGDLYVAERYTGLHLLTCHHVNDDLGCVIAMEMAYPYNIRECIKVDPR